MLKIPRHKFIWTFYFDLSQTPLIFSRPEVWIWTEMFNHLSKTFLKVYPLRRFMNHEMKRVFSQSVFLMSDIWIFI